MGKNYRHFVPVPNVFNLKSVDWKLFSYHEIRVGQIRATRPKSPCRTYPAPDTQFRRLCSWLSDFMEIQ